MKLVLPSVLVLVLLLTCSACTKDPQIDVRKLGDDWYQLMLKSSRTADVAAGQLQLMPTAARLCGSKPVRFGRYEFQAQETVGASESQSLSLQQEIHCDVASIPELHTLAPTGSGWRPTGGDRETIERLTYEYFAAKDRGDVAAAFAMLAGEVTTLERWGSSIRRFNAVAGEVRSRRIKKVTWYKDPPQASQPGVYAAVDFASTFENINIHCGFVAWHRQPDGSFLVIREEQNYIDKKTETSAGATDLAQLRAKFGC